MPVHYQTLPCPIPARRTTDAIRLVAAIWTFGSDQTDEQINYNEIPPIRIWHCSALYSDAVGQMASSL